MADAAGQGPSTFHWGHLQLPRDKGSRIAAEKTELVHLCSASLGRSPLSLFMYKVRFLREIQVPPRADISRILTCRFTSAAAPGSSSPRSGLPAAAALDKTWHCATCPEKFPGSAVDECSSRSNRNCPLKTWC